MAKEGKREGEESYQEPIKHSRSTAKKVTVLVGEASRGGINATKCRNEFGHKPDVRITDGVSQQTDEWNNGHKGARISEGAPHGEKQGPAWLGIG